MICETTIDVPLPTISPVIDCLHHPPLQIQLNLYPLSTLYNLKHADAAVDIILLMFDICGRGETFCITSSIHVATFYDLVIDGLILLAELRDLHLQPAGMIASSYMCAPCSI